VRNPFARALSAYVDKVANDPAVWPVFLKRFGLKPDVGKRELSFRDFISLIAVAHDDLLDGHFRPQCRNLLVPLAKPVFIGFVENMKPVGRFLESRGVAFHDERLNATRAQQRLDTFYDSRAAALVRERYSGDFAAFGYSTELAEVRARPCADVMSMRDGRADLLLRWLATGKPPPGIAAEPRSPFVTFNRSRDREQKLRMTRRGFDTEHNWYRLERYLDFVARKSRDMHLREAIRQRMTALRARYLKAVNDPKLFVAFQ
jgi:hypothetical protein